MDDDYVVENGPPPGDPSDFLSQPVEPPPEPEGFDVPAPPDLPDEPPPIEVVQQAPDEIRVDESLDTLRGEPPPA